MRVSFLIRSLLIGSLSATLLACGGGGGGGSSPPPPNGGGDPPPTTHSVMAAVTGLQGELTLQLNAANDLRVPANGTFPFAVKLATASAYEVTIKTGAANQRCEVRDGKGTIANSDVTVAVICGPDPVETHSINVTVTGLDGQLTLQSKDVDDLTVTANGTFPFTPSLPAGSGYNVTVRTQPANQRCDVSNGGGTITDSDAAVEVTCSTNPPGTHNVNFTVTGLKGSLTMRSPDLVDRTVNRDGTFTFTPSLLPGKRYDVTVKIQPDNQHCAVTNGAGDMPDADVTASVLCEDDRPDQHSLSVSVSGLNGNTVVVRNTANGDTIVRSNGSSIIGNFVPGTAFALSVVAHPSYPAADCAFNGNPSGTINDVDVTVTLTCTAFSQVDTLRAELGARQVRTVRLQWTRAPRTRSENLFISTRRDCDFSSSGFESCPGAKVLDAATGITPGFQGTRLRLGQAYFFQVETVFDNGARQLSNLSSARPSRLSFGGQVRAIAPGAPGTVYVGGAFTSVGLTSGAAVPLNVRTGRFTMADFPEVTGVVNAVVSDGGGGWYVGGEFTSVGGVARQNLVHIRANNSVDADFTLEPNGPVQALAKAGNRLFVGGTFQQISGTGVSNLAGIFIPTGTVIQWLPNPNDTVRALAVMGNAQGNALYVGGDFDDNGRPRFLRSFALDGGGSPANFPAAFDLNLNNSVRALAVHGSSLFVSGAFTPSANMPRWRVAKADLPDGGTIPQLSASFDPDPGINEGGATVNAISVANDGRTVYLGGRFTQIRGPGGITNRNFLVAVTATGLGEGTTLPWAPQPDGEIRALATAPDGTIFAGGAFTSIGSGIGHLNQFAFAALNPITAFSLPAFALNPRGGQVDQDGAVNALTIAGDALYVGGDFISVNGEQRARLAAVADDGSLLGWDPGTEGVVNALLYRRGTDRVYVGGLFGTIGNQPRNSLAMLDGTTAAVLPADDADGSFFAQTNPGAEVRAFAIREDLNTLYVGGNFGGIAGIDYRNLAALFLNNGTIELPFRPEPNGAVNAILSVRERTASGVFRGDFVYAGGEFTDIRHATNETGFNNRRRLAKIDADEGRHIAAFFRTPNGTVNALALSGSQDLSVLYVGGDFTQIDGTQTGRLAAIAANSALLTGNCDPTTGSINCFEPGAPGPVRALAYDGGDNIVSTGGSFGGIGGLPTTNFAVLTGRNAGTTGNALGRFVFPNGTVQAVATAIGAAGDIRIYVGGSFTAINPSVDGASPGSTLGNFAVIDRPTGRLVE